MCDFCRKEHRTKIHTEINGVSVCIVNIIPLPAINLTTGEREKNAREPFFQIRFYDEDMEIEDYLTITHCPMCGEKIKE